MLSTQYSPYTTVQSSYEWAMNRRWVLWLSLAERCYYNIISPLIGQNLPSDASDWLTRLLTRNSVTLGECELCIVSSTANRDNGAQRSERRGRAASPASGSSHNSAVSVSIKTSMQRYFAQVFYVFFVINQLNIVKVDPCMLCEWWLGPVRQWAETGQRTSRQIIHDPSHVIIDSEFRQPRSHSGLNNEALSTHCNGYLPDEDDTIKSRIVRYHFSWWFST